MRSESVEPVFDAQAAEILDGFYNRTKRRIDSLGLYCYAPESEDTKPSNGQRIESDELRVAVFAPANVDTSFMHAEPKSNEACVARPVRWRKEDPALITVQPDSLLEQQHELNKGMQKAFGGLILRTVGGKQSFVFMTSEVEAAWGHGVAVPVNQLDRMRVTRRRHFSS